MRLLQESMFFSANAMDHILHRSRSYWLASFDSENALLTDAKPIDGSQCSVCASQAGRMYCATFDSPMCAGWTRKPGSEAVERTVQQHCLLLPPLQQWPLAGKCSPNMSSIIDTALHSKAVIWSPMLKIRGGH